MLGAQDIALLEGMFSRQGAEIERKLTRRFGEILGQNNLDLIRTLRDEVHSIVTASEYRMKTAIISEVTNFIGESILPQIEEFQIDMKRVKIELKLA
ncbi:MAG: hypothetical protein WAZ14_00070 [Patescibacteria group bacterium]